MALCVIIDSLSRLLLTITFKSKWLISMHMTTDATVSNYTYIYWCNHITLSTYMTVRSIFSLVLQFLILWYTLIGPPSICLSLSLSFFHIFLHSFIILHVFPPAPCSPSVSLCSIRLTSYLWVFMYLGVSNYYVYLSINLSINVSISQIPIYLPVYLFIHLSIFLFIHLYVSLYEYVCLTLHLNRFLYCYLPISVCTYAHAFSCPSFSCPSCVYIDVSK